MLTPQDCRRQPIALWVAAVAIALLLLATAEYGARHVALLVIGLAMGVTLYHAAFGFSSAYRRLIADRDLSGVTAQIVMIGFAVLLFAPVLSGAFTDVLGVAPGGAVAPVGVGLVFGATLFGVGMQLAGGCASGTLYTAGGASVRMLVVLFSFCAGAFLGSLHLHWWLATPTLGAVSLGQSMGWPLATGLQLSALALLWLGLRAAGARDRQRLWWHNGLSWNQLLRGPWPPLLAALLLAILNVSTLLVAGHPWSITWAFALWPAKIATQLGWDPTTSPFWSDGFPNAALIRPVLADTVSAMNIGILAGAFLAAAAAGRIAPVFRIPLRSLAAAIVGGIAMGYGARLAFGCNIGAFFSGVASASLHGWVWIIAAAFGTWAGVRLRPLFRLPL